MVLLKTRTLKGFGETNWLLERKQNFDILEGKTVSRKFQRTWKKSIENGVGNPSKVKDCEDCLWSSNGMCETCEKRIYQIAEIKLSLDELKGKPPNEKGQMLT